MTGYELKMRRQAVGMSQFELAKKTGYSPQGIADNEQKRDKTITTKLEIRVRRLLDRLEAK